MGRTEVVSLALEIRMHATAVPIHAQKTHGITAILLAVPKVTTVPIKPENSALAASELLNADSLTAAIARGLIYCRHLADL